MFMLHTRLPDFIQRMKNAALHHEKEVSCKVIGLENLASAKIQSARTGRLEREVEELSQVPGAASMEVQILPRVPETLHTVVIKVLDEDGKPIKAILDTVGILHPGVDTFLEGCPDVDDRRPRIGQH